MCLTRNWLPPHSTPFRWRPPRADRIKPQHLCLDKGYTGEPVDRQVRQRGYTPHVPRKTNEG